jgi:hypothetical protein
MSKVWNYKSKKNDKLAKTVKDKGDDIVMTNPEMAKYLLSLIDFPDKCRVLEPAKGKGAFYDNFPNNVEKLWCEINDGKDFLQFNEKVDFTISNPPFVPRKLFWEFHKKAMEVTNTNIYWLINLYSLNVFTPKRLDEMKSKNWFIEHFHIVNDKRWFGRYAFIRFGRDINKNCMSFCETSF